MARLDRMTQRFAVPCLMSVAWVPSRDQPRSENFRVSLPLVTVQLKGRLVLLLNPPVPLTPWNTIPRTVIPPNRFSTRSGAVVDPAAGTDSTTTITSLFAAFPLPNVTDD